MTTRASSPADSQEIDALRALVETLGLEGAQRTTRLGRATITRALARLPVTTGTRAAIREAVRVGDGVAEVA